MQLSTQFDIGQKVFMFCSTKRDVIAVTVARINAHFQITPVQVEGRTESQYKDLSSYVVVNEEGEQFTRTVLFDNHEACKTYAVKSVRDTEEGEARYREWGG